MNLMVISLSKSISAARHLAMPCKLAKKAVIIYFYYHTDGAIGVFVLIILFQTFSMGFPKIFFHTNLVMTIMNPPNKFAKSFEPLSSHIT